MSFFSIENLPYTLIFVAIGVVIGAALSKILNRGPSVTELQDKLDEAQDQLNQYQQQVGSHFQKTAELVNSLTESYQQVHEHLSQGAQNLAVNHTALEGSQFKALAESKSEDSIDGDAQAMEGEEQNTDNQSESEQSPNETINEVPNTEVAAHETPENADDEQRNKH